MTDGIIQKAFKKNGRDLKEIIEIIRDSVDYDIYNELIDGQAQLQEDIIQGIKDEFWDHSNAVNNDDILKILIGDTE